MAKPQNADYAMEELKEAMAHLYETKEDADLDIICGETTFKVHSLLFWPRSKFFAAACKGGFKEAASKRIELPDDNPRMVWRMIRYFYLGDYPDSVSELTLTLGPEEKMSTFKANAEMYSLGDKYGIKGLQKVAAEKFRTALDKHKGRASELANLPNAIHWAYNTVPDTDRTLRDIVFDLARHNWKDLIRTSGFKNMMARNPSFVIDVVDKMCELPYMDPSGRCKSTGKWKVDHVRCACGWGESVTRSSSRSVFETLLEG